MGGRGVPDGASPDRPGSNRTAAAGPQGAAPADIGAVIVPEVNTAIVARGDNLWRISRRIYGQGTRYTVIYGANAQIRDPDLIYPGQVFVLPSPEASKEQGAGEGAGQGGSRP
jgi:nucleoid-associated protein YgaU